MDDASGNGPLVGAEVDVVDSSGRKSSGKTDVSGTVKIADVAVPYDLSVTHALLSSPVVILGRRERSIRVPVSTPPSLPESQRKHTFTVQLQVPPCTPSCALFVLSKSVHGIGQLVDALPNSASWRPVTVTLNHSFYLGGMGASELVTMHAIVRNDAQTVWAYKEIASLGEKGGASTVGGSLVPIGTRGTVTVNALLPDATDNFTPSVGVSLLLAGGARLPLLTAESTAGVAIVPDIPGSRIQGTASLRDMDLARMSDNELYSQAGSDAAPPTTSSIDVTVYSPPIMTSPLFGGELPLGATAISWTSGAPGFAYAELYDIDHAKPVAIVFTDARAIPLASLKALGFTLTPSTYALDLSTDVGVKLAEVIDGSALSRRPVWISDVAHGATRASFRFAVSP